LADEPIGPTTAALVSAHNREREREGRKPLQLSARLCESAAIHALDMAKHRKLDHNGSDGSTVADRVKRKGYAYVRVGENIAEGQETVEQVMSTWLKSPGHRENILGDFTEIGAVRVEDETMRGRELGLRLAANVPTPEEAATALVGDDGGQIASYRQIGVGYAMAKSGTPYWCAIFAKPLTPKRRVFRGKGGSP
jgi:uncharacterized protein YkwD